MRILFLSLIAVLSLTACGDSEVADYEQECRKIKKFDNPEDYNNCYYPNPPVGRFHAVYTESFAKEYDLPLENVSHDLSEGVDYMEIDVQPLSEIFVTCWVNMLVRKPHDIALYGPQENYSAHLKRDLIKIEKIKVPREKIRSLNTFSKASRDYNNTTKGYRGSTTTFFVESINQKYDYFSSDIGCSNIAMHPKNFPDEYAFWVAKASVWGRHERNFDHIDDKGRPQGKDFFESHFFINVPEELISKIYKDVYVGGKKR